MNKKRIGGLRWRAKRPMTTKPISLKPTGGKSDGCGSKAVELTSGDLRQVTETGLRGKRKTHEAESTDAPTRVELLHSSEEAE
jgi:hypothetical protein